MCGGESESSTTANREEERDRKASLIDKSAINGFAFYHVRKERVTDRRGEKRVSGDRNCRCSRLLLSAGGPLSAFEVEIDTPFLRKSYSSRAPCEVLHSACNVLSNLRHIPSISRRRNW